MKTSFYYHVLEQKLISKDKKVNSMTKFINYRMFLFVLMIAVSIEGKSQVNLSLDECKKQALEHNQTIKVKQANYKSNEASLKLAKRLSLPNFDFDANYLYANDPMQMKVPAYELPNLDGTPSGVFSPGATTNLQYHNTYKANIGANLPLYLGGKLIQARQIATNSMEIAKSEIALSQTEVLLNIETQYWTLVSLIETKKLSLQSIQFLNDVVTDVNNLYESGVVTKNEVLKAKVELNNAKLSDISLHNNIKMLKMALNQSIGKAINKPLLIADTTIDVHTKLNLSQGLQANPDKRQELQLLTNVTQIYESEQKIVSADFKPKLIAFGNYYYQNPNHLSEEQSELTWNAGLALSIPIFHWGERNLKKTKAKMKIAGAEYQFEQTKEFLTLEIQQALLKMEESTTKLQFTIEALEQAEENLTLETNRLQEELSTTTDLLNAQVQWQKAQADYISAKTNVKISEAKYLKAIGELNP